jgi:hypothetical protein
MHHHGPRASNKGCEVSHLQPHLGDCLQDKDTGDIVQDIENEGDDREGTESNGDDAESSENEDLAIPIRALGPWGGLWGPVIPRWGCMARGEGGWGGPWGPAIPWGKNGAGGWWAGAGEISVRSSFLYWHEGSGRDPSRGPRDRGHRIASGVRHGPQHKGRKGSLAQRFACTAGMTQARNGCCSDPGITT